MDISITASPSRNAAHIKIQSNAAQAERKLRAPAIGRTQDQAAISPEARVALQQEEHSETATTFPPFAEEFIKITDEYADVIRTHYAKEHEENLTYDSPSTHIWNKYKNPDAPEFRSDLSEDERAWAYDQELDLLSGGKHLQMRNPYAFSSVGGPPTLASAALKAMAASRSQIDQSIQTLFAEHGIVLPEGTSLRFTVDQADYSIHVTGLDDDSLSEAIEQALNQGDNGKNLYHHLKLTTPAGEELGVDYADGHLAPVDTQRELDDSTLSEIKKQAGPTWARYSTTYNPHQEAMNDKILTLEPDSPLNTKEQMDRLSAAVRVGAPEIIAEFRARQNHMSLPVHPNHVLNPDGSVSLDDYLRA